MLQTGRSRFRFPMRSLDCHNPSSRTMALGSTQPLTEMSIRNLPAGEGRPEREAEGLIAICRLIVYKMWDPRRLTTLWAFTACCRDSFTFTLISIHGTHYCTEVSNKGLLDSVHQVANFDSKRVRQNLLRTSEIRRRFCSVS
jgi:hypothetical protein